METIKEIYYGSNKIKQVYKGSTLIWGGVSGESVSHTFDKTLLSVSQIVIRNSAKDDYCYSWLLKFDDGYVMPVGISKDGSVDSFDDTLMQQIDTTAKHASSLNGGCYVSGVLTPTYARDAADLIEYISIDSKNMDSMTYPKAKELNWDEGHLVNNHCSVTTSRFAFTLSDGVFTATDTYNNNKLVAKYGYKIGELVKTED